MNQGLEKNAGSIFRKNNNTETKWNMQLPILKL